jgi:cell cycle checkpoint protein
MADPPIFSAVSTSARQLYLLLRCIAFSPTAEVEISPHGIKFSVEEARVVQGLTFLDKKLFSSYTCILPENDHALPPFSISINALLETLQIFGIAEATSLARNPYGGFSSSYGNAFSTPALGLGGMCRFSYQEVGAPLTITIQEGSVTTTCEMNTYEVEERYEDEDGGIPLDRSKLCLKAIMRSVWLSDAISELSGTNPTVLVVNISGRSAPFFSLEGEGGPYGDSTVDFTPESKHDPVPGGAKGKKQPLVAETFVVSAPSGKHGRIKQRYKFDMINKASKAMALASKVSVRQDEQGVLSLQFMIDLVESANSGSRREDGPASNAAPSPASVAFVDFRFVPLLDDEETESEDQSQEDESNEQDEDLSA